MEENKIDPLEVKKGHILGLMYYVKVDDNTTMLNDDGSYSYDNDGNIDRRLVAQDLHTTEGLMISGNSLIESCSSADQVTSTKNATKTEIAETLVKSFNKPFTVEFIKQDGTVRVLRGRLIKPSNIFGYSEVEDLDIEDVKGRFRMVTHSNLLSITVDGVKLKVSEAARKKAIKEAEIKADAIKTVKKESAKKTVAKKKTTTKRKPVKK